MNRACFEMVQIPFKSFMGKGPKTVSGLRRAQYKAMDVPKSFTLSILSFFLHLIVHNNIDTSSKWTTVFLQACQYMCKMNISCYRICLAYIKPVVETVPKILVWKISNALLINNQLFTCENLSDQRNTYQQADSTANLFAIYFSHFHAVPEGKKKQYRWRK